MGTQILVATARLLVSGHYQTFFKVYWATEALYTVLALLAEARSVKEASPIR